MIRHLVAVVAVLAGVSASLAQTKPELALQLGHTQPVNAVAFSPDGKIMITGAFPRDVIVRDTATGRELHKLTVPGIRCITLHPDGRHMVLSGRSARNTVSVFDVASGKEVKVFKPENQPDNLLVGTALFSPNGKLVAVEAAREASKPSHIPGIVIFDADTGRQLRRLEGFPTLLPGSGGTQLTDAYVPFSFAPDSRTIAVMVRVRTEQPHPVQLWDVETGQRLRDMDAVPGEDGTVAFPSAASQVAFLLGGKYIAACFWRREVVVWECGTGKVAWIWRPTGGWADYMAASPDGALLAIGVNEKKVLLLDAKSGRTVATVTTVERPGQGRGETWCSSMAFTPDGKHLLVGSSDADETLYSVATGQRVRSFDPGVVGVRCAAIRPDGKQFVTVPAGTTVVVWDRVRAQPSHLLQEHPDVIHAARYSPKGDRIVVGCGDGTVVVWDSATGQRVGSFRAHAGPVHAIAFSPDGRRFGTASADKTGAVWDIERLGRVHELRGHSDRLFGIVFSPDGKWIGTSSVNHCIVWDAATGRAHRTLEESDRLVGRVSFVAAGFSRDGSTFFAAASRLISYTTGWDVESGKQIGHYGSYSSYSGTLAASALTPDGRSVLSSHNQFIQAFNTADGKPGEYFLGHTLPIRDFGISADGKFVLTASDDGTARVWDAATRTELLRLIALDGGRDWLTCTPDGLFDGSAGGRNAVSYRVNGQVVPVDHFFKDFYRPGLLTAVWGGGRPKPEVDFASQAPPTVRIVKPAQSGTVDTPAVTIEAEATDAGGGVEGPWLVHNGARVVARGQARKDGKVTTRTFDVLLVTGENRLEVRAASADGSWESEPARLTLRYEKPLDKPELHVVAVGVSAYAHDPLQLKLARADAEAVAKLFRDRGTALYKEVHAATLLDEKATKAGIRDALKDVAKRAKPQDTLVVFLAGHGAVVGQRYYFLPHEYTPTAGGRAEDDVSRQGLPADELGDLLGLVPALKRVLVLDTCGSGAAVGLAGGGRNPFAFRGAVERLGRSQGVFTLAAAAAGDEAKEVPELGHGVLTYALLAGLGGAAGGPLDGQPIKPTNPEGVADVLEWFGYASGHVPRLTKRYFGREQDVQSSGQGTSFPVLPVARS